jgi:hypothetical protein
MTPSGLDPATLRLAAQCLSQLRYMYTYMYLTVCILNFDLRKIELQPDRRDRNYNLSVRV